MKNGCMLQEVAALLRLEMTTKTIKAINYVKVYTGMQDKLLSTSLLSLKAIHLTTLWGGDE